LRMLFKSQDYLCEQIVNFLFRYFLKIIVFVPHSVRLLTLILEVELKKPVSLRTRASYLLSTKLHSKL
jgi:hypothetical protein